jgi:hypothetical protein
MKIHQLVLINKGDNKMFNKFFKGAVVALTAAFLAPVSAIADSIDPATYADTLAVGESVTITKTVTVDEGSPTGGILDVMFLIDTSGSMGGEIAAAKAAAADVLSGLSGFGDLAAGVGYYDEPGPGPGYPPAILSDLSTSADATIFDGITLAMGGGGGDFPEEGIRSVTELATGASWRPGSTRFIIALGDATFKETDGFTEAGALAAMDDENITFIGIDYGLMTYVGHYGSSGDVEVNPQDLADATGGSIISASGLDTGDLVDDITSGIAAAFDEYTEVTVSDLGAGLPGVDVSVVCTSADIGACVGADAVGSYDRSTSRTFTYDVTFTALEEGVHDFSTCGLVDGGVAACERDTITVGEGGSVPEPGILALLSMGLIGFVATSRRRA